MCCGAGGGPALGRAIWGAGEADSGAAIGRAPGVAGIACVIDGASETPRSRCGSGRIIGAGEGVADITGAPMAGAGGRG